MWNEDVGALFGHVLYSLDHDRFYFMMTSSNGNIFRVTGPLCGELNNREAGDFRRHRGHYDVSVMSNAVYEHFC